MTVPVGRPPPPPQQALQERAASRHGRPRGRLPDGQEQPRPASRARTRGGRRGRPSADRPCSRAQAKASVEPALREPHPRPHGGDRPHVRGEVADVHALRLVEQLERRRRGRPPPHGPAPSPPASGSRFCGRPACSPSSGLARQVPSRGGEVATFAEQLAHARRACPPCHAAAAPCSSRQRSPRSYVAHGVAQAGPARSGCRPSAMRAPSVSEWCPARSRLRHAVRAPAVRGVEVAARPSGRAPATRPPRRAPGGRPSPARSSTRWACSIGARQVAARPGPARPGTGRSWPAGAELLLVHDDHRRSSARPSAARRPASARRRAGGRSTPSSSP